MRILTVQNRKPLALDEVFNEASMTQLSPFFCPYTSDYNTGFELKDCFQPLFMYYVGILSILL